MSEPTSNAIEVRTTPAVADFQRFQRFHLFRKNWAIAFLPSAILSGFAILNLNGGHAGSAVIFLVMALLLPLFMLLVSHLMGRLHLRTAKMYSSMENLVFRFDEQGFFNETHSGGIDSTLRCGWEKFYRVYESRAAFYLYISNMQAFIVPKRDIVVGDAEQLKELFKKVLPSKVYRGSR